MAILGPYFQSTIGRKQIIGLTGLALSLFVLSHALGNMLIFLGPEAYNLYSHSLVSNPLIYIAEAGLVLLFFTHLGLALKISLLNAKSRDGAYAVSASGEKSTSAVTKTMWHQGAILFVFVVYHLMTFKYGTYYEASYNDKVVRDIFRLVVEVFQDPIYLAGYILCMVVLGFHLSHGFSSAIQTLGFNHPKHTPKIEKAGLCFALLVSLMFISQPIYVYLFYKG